MTNVIVRLVAIMTVVCILSVVVTTYFLYRAEVDRYESRLEQQASRVARGIDVLFKHNIEYIRGGHQDSSGRYDAYIKDRTVELIKSILSPVSIEEDVEITVGYSKDGSIYWIIQTLRSSESYVPVSLESNWAEPMRLALNKMKGVDRGIDYKGDKVLAAYTYVDSIKFGVVAKTHVAHIQNQFLKGAQWAILPTLILVALGVVLFYRLISPIIRKIKEDVVFYKEMCDRIDHAQEELKASKHRLQCFFDAAFEGIAITEYGKFIDGNERFSDMFGYEHEEMLGMPIKNLVYKEDRELVFKNIRDNYEEAYEHRSVHKDGSIRYLEVHGQETVFEGRKVRMTAIHDITERKKAEEELVKINEYQRQTSKIEALGNFASGIAHDFNNALTPIIGNCEILLMDMPDELKYRCERPVLAILSAAETAGLLVHRMQSFTRKEHDVDTLMPLRLPNCLREAFGFLRSLIPTSIEMDIGMDGNLELVMASDVVIRQILMNLCKNAAQAMPNDEGRISIYVSNEKIMIERYGLSIGKYVRMEVEDTGNGMTPEVLERALDPYFTTKKEGEGTGIGLSVVDNIVSSLGGVVRIYSEEDLGTKVSIYIPAVEAIKGAVRECITDEPPIMGNGESILLVDDEEPIIEAIAQVIESLNYKVTSYSKSSEAYTEFKNNPDEYDLLLTDLTMPGFTGLTLIEKIREIRPEIKIILCSGLGSNGKRLTEETISTIDNYVSKPLTRHEYAEIISEALKSEEI